MGLDANKRTPCGFCFVSYFTRKDAESAVKYINGSMMDGRSIRVDHDWGFVEGRQFGRGKTGGQVRYQPEPWHTSCMLAALSQTVACSAGVTAQSPNIRMCITQVIISSQTFEGLCDSST